MTKIFVLTIFASFSLSYTYTTKGSECLMMTKDNFTLSDRNVIVDVEKYLARLIKVYNNDSLDRIQKIQTQIELGKKALKARSMFTNLYCPSEFYKKLPSKEEQTLAGKIPYFAGIYNIQVADHEKDKLSIMLSFGLEESQKGKLKEGGLTSFQIADRMANKANSHKNQRVQQAKKAERTVNSILFNSTGENATLEEVLEVMKSTKGRFILNGYPKLGLITPVAEGGSQSICKNASDAEEQEITEIVKNLHQIFVGPFTCSETSSAEECVSHVIRSVEDCSNRINKSRGVNHAELLPLGILTATISFGKDYLTRGKYWCLLSKYAEETGRQVIMLDEDGFIRDYVEESLIWDEPDENAGDITTTAISVSVAAIVVVVLGIILILQYIRNYRNKLSRFLTKSEAQEFFDGKSSESGRSYVGSAYNRELEINKDDIMIDTDNILGSGTFGCVYGGHVVLDGLRQEVAIKTMRKHFQSATTLRGLCSEIKVLTHLGTHEHIVSLVGAYTAELEKGLIYVVMEMCPRGSLEKYLRRLKSPENDVYAIVFETDSTSNAEISGLTGNNQQTELIRFCREIFSGVEYMASKRIIHGDLAARNILLTSNLQAKISDFGLSRRLYEYSVYVKKQAEPLPWRWMAPETLTRLEFSEKSDVWSFGVTVWEIFSFGNTPYPGLGWRLDFPKELERGLRLEMPEECPQHFYDTMLTCWHMNPNDRPTFSQLKEKLGLD